MKKTILITLSIFLFLLFGIFVKRTSPESKEQLIRFPFIYQLQNADFETLYKTDFHIAVVDWEDANFTPSQLQQLKSQGKVILSYLSIGEAEDYRDYWISDWSENPPDFLEQENPEWKGNYKVKYWDEEWQKIVFEKLNSIINAGYDGVYLDIIDAYSYFEEKGRDTAKQEMVNFVVSISQKARQWPDFLVITQNSPELIAESGYPNAIDGLGKEDTWYFDDKTRDPDEVDKELYYLDLAINEGKFVLATDYPTQREKQCDFIKRAKTHQFYYFISDRELSGIKEVHCKQ